MWFVHSSTRIGVDMSGIIGNAKSRGSGTIESDGIVKSVSGSTGVVVDSDIHNDSLANFAANEHYTQANITALGTVTSGNISHADIVFPAGHIIQVQSDVVLVTDGQSVGTNSASHVDIDSNFTCSIIPKYATSDIIWSFFTGNALNASNSYEMVLGRQINGGGYKSAADFTEVATDDLGSLEDGLFQGAYATITTKHTVSMTFIDTTHNTTDQIDYKVYIKVDTGWVYMINGSGVMTMIAMEVKR